MIRPWKPLKESAIISIDFTSNLISYCRNTEPEGTSKAQAVRLALLFQRFVLPEIVSVG